MNKKTATRGTELWNKAKRLIPGGNQLLSKRSEMFLPEKWPSYYKKAKGVEIWDLDDERYIDMCIMGIGTCILGYAHPDVDRAVKEAIDLGSMSSLNCYEEVALAEKLISLHPWAEKVRFAKTGGEAVSIAVRIARTHTGKDKIAFSGYHGWHDWYLSANLSSQKNLDGLLLPGLQPAGVPKALTGTSFPFHYGKIDELKKIVADNKNEIGVIVMEVARHEEVNAKFMEEALKIAKEIKAVMIFDEVSSGFRLTNGGMHRLYGFNPDIMVLGKALGNGYPISAIVGKDDVMDAAQSTFISSTYWTERVGFAAALTTIKVYEEKNVSKHLEKVGNLLREGLKNIFKKSGLDIKVAGLISIPTMVSAGEDALVIKTIFTQEMLKKGYLASNVIYLSLAHTEEIIRSYLKEAEEVFMRIAENKKNNRLKEMLEGPVCHSGFMRLT